MSSNDGNSNYKTNWWPDGTMPGGSLLGATGDDANYYGDDKKDDDSFYLQLPKLYFLDIDEYSENFE